MTDDKEIDYGNITLEEVDQAIEGANDFDTLVNNLHNIQRRQGGHNPVFRIDTPNDDNWLHHSVTVIREIQSLAEQGVPLDSRAVQTQIDMLPRQVGERATVLYERELNSTQEL